MLAARTLPGIGHLAELRVDWDRLWMSCRCGVNGPDATAAATWGEALLATHVREASIQTLLVTSDDQLVGLIPTFKAPSNLLPSLLRERRALTEAYGGRSSLLFAGNDQGVTEFSLGALSRCLPECDVLVFSTVEGSRAHANVSRAAEGLGIHIRHIGLNESPYISLSGQWNAVLSGLPKKMRWLLRKSESELSSLGSLTYQEIREPSQVPGLLSDIFEIERRSWKEDSGSSITAQARQRTFYEVLLPLAAQRGILSAHILRLNAQPISYILGICAGDQTFLDLKESFDMSFSEWSPGHVIKRFAIERLIARGVETYDFMGKCEPYKMRWTSKTYRTLQCAMYTRTIRGRLLASPFLRIRRR